jgi:hypothetical protein
VVAEGIETDGELAAVRVAGVSSGQGYGLAPPQSLPLAPLEYAPAPFVDLVAEDRGLRRDVQSDRRDASGGDHPSTVHRMRAGMAAMERAIALLRQSDGRMTTDQFRAVCAVLARQRAALEADLDELAGPAVPSPSPLD